MTNLASHHADHDGALSDDQRVKGAMAGFVKGFGRLAALYLETCIHCGMCAEACHFYEVTKDPKYTPVWKIEPMKRAYQREYGPFAPVYRLLGLSPKLTIAQLDQWQELLYESCTECGRCSLICPMGIDITGLIVEARAGMAEAGLVPRELWLAARSANDPVEIETRAVAFRQRIAEISTEYQVAIPLDHARADILCTATSTDLNHYPAAVAGMARILNHLGCDWTFRSDAFEATNFGALAGRREWQEAECRKLVEVTLATGANLLLLPECGHGYGVMRWSAASIYGHELPFAVQHVSEFLADMVQNGKLRLRKVAASVTFHDPCQVARRGGVFDAPRIVLDALGVDLHEMDPTRGTNWCCGGGGGVVNIAHADRLRHRVFELKRTQVENSGADLAVTSCSTCRRTFDDARDSAHWDRTIGGLVELVAEHLDEDAP